MPTYCLKLENDTLAAIVAGEEEATELIVRDITDEDAGLLRMMSHYCKDDRGAPHESTLVVNAEYIALKSDYTGTMMIEFHEFAYYGCENMDVHEDHEVDVPFRILVESAQIQFEVPVSSTTSYWHANE